MENTLDLTGTLSAYIAGEQASQLPPSVMKKAKVHILDTIAAPRPFFTLLWLEYQVSPEAQSIIDEYGPLNSSIYASDSALARITKGKKVSVNNWDTLENTAKWQDMVFKAFGFPKVDDTKK